MFSTEPDVPRKDLAGPLLSPRNIEATPQWCESIELLAISSNPIVMADDSLSSAKLLGFEATAIEDSAIWKANCFS
jgi:hypothetical protein